MGKNQMHRRNMLQSCGRGVSAKRTQADRREGLMSKSFQETRATEKPISMFSPESKSSIFKSANPPNLERSLLEGNKDHLLSQARADLMKQELQVDSEVRIKLMLKDWNCRAHSTDILNLDENKFVHKKNYL